MIYIYNVGTDIQLPCFCNDETQNTNKPHSLNLMVQNQSSKGVSKGRFVKTGKVFEVLFQTVISFAIVPATVVPNYGCHL